MGPPPGHKLAYSLTSAEAQSVRSVVFSGMHLFAAVRNNVLTFGYDDPTNLNSDASLVRVESRGDNSNNNNSSKTATRSAASTRSRRQRAKGKPRA